MLSAILSTLEIDDLGFLNLSLDSDLGDDMGEITVVISVSEFLLESGVITSRSELARLIDTSSVSELAREKDSASEDIIEMKNKIAKRQNKRHAGQFFLKRTYFIPRNGFNCFNELLRSYHVIYYKSFTVY